MKVLNIDGYDIKIGQNKKENELLLNEMKSNYTWFHIKNYPSAHLWLEESYNNISKQLLYKCALELKKCGKYRKSNNIDIIYTLGKNIEYDKSTVYTNKSRTIKV
tara:strand:- start:171 stop:485 length:315 start_codon:yes stop_codon:yes gene_type:complete